MANEATIRDRISNAIDFTWFNDNSGALKGTILKLSGARTVAPASADNDILIGVLGRDKIAGDTRTQVPVYINGIFDCYFDAACATGVQVTISGANILKIYSTLDDEKGYVLGRLIEAATAGAYAQVLVGVGA
jgi:type 1 fimbria pilin